MSPRELETHWWNLPMLAACTAMASCGPLVVPTGQTDTDAVTDAGTDSSPQATGADTTAAPCSDASECEPGYDCIGGVCSPPEYCASGCCYDSGGCCYDDCCDGDCHYAECYDDEECGPYGLCEGGILEGYCRDTLPLGECADGLTLEVLQLPTGGTSGALAFVEVDDDPAQELVVARMTGAMLYPGPGEMYVPLPVPAGSSVRDITSGDFDGDGDGDLVMVIDMGQLIMLVNDGAGTFTLSQQIELESSIYAMKTLQWNDDLVLDVVGLTVDDRVLVQTIEPMGVFGQSYALPPTFVESFTVTDFGDDLYGDLVVQSDGSAQVYRGSAAGDVDVDMVLPGLPRSTRKVAAGPIVGMTPWEVMGHASLDAGWQLLELWTGGSGDPQLYSLPGPAWYVLAGDVDGSSTTDLVTVYESTFSYVRTQAIDGIPSFECYVPFVFDGQVINVGMGDFDGNGRDDVLVVTLESELWMVLSQ